MARKANADKKAPYVADDIEGIDDTDSALDDRMDAQQALGYGGAPRTLSSDDSYS